MRRDAGIVEEDERRSVSKRLGQSMSRSEVGQTGTNCWKWAKPEASDEAHVRPYARGAFKKKICEGDRTCGSAARNWGDVASRDSNKMR
jgi:hypothetical protein